MSDRRPSRVGKRAINFYLDPEIWMRVQQVSLYQGRRSIQSMMEEAVADYLVKVADRRAVTGRGRETVGAVTARLEQENRELRDRLASIVGLATI